MSKIYVINFQVVDRNFSYHYTCLILKCQSNYKYVSLTSLFHLITLINFKNESISMLNRSNEIKIKKKIKITNKILLKLTY